MLYPASGFGLSVPPGGCSIHADVTTGTVTIGGEIDHVTAPQLTAASIRLLSTSGRDLTVSLRDVTFADSALVDALEDVQRVAKASARRVRLIDLPPRVTQMIRLAGAADLLLLAPAIAEAKASSPKFVATVWHRTCVRRAEA